MSIAENLARLRPEIPPGVRIVAVSKTHPAGRIREAYDAGQRCFGENRAQELAAKHLQLPPDIEWHFVGHLQTNKVRFIATFVSLVHSADRLSVLQELDRAAARNGRIIDCLLQFHIATEETKFGFSEEEAAVMLASPDFQELMNIRVCGVMGMATFTNDHALVRREFRMLRNHFERLKTAFFSMKPEFREISMGMSGDYHIAIEEGSTMVRIGTGIFGERE